MSGILLAHGVDFGLAADRHVCRHLEDPVFLLPFQQAIWLSGGEFPIRLNLINHECSMDFLSVKEQWIRERFPHHIPHTLYGGKNAEVGVCLPLIKDIYKDWHFIYMIRHPIEAAMSAAKMMSRPLHQMLEAWWNYNILFQTLITLYPVSYSLVDYPSLRGLNRALSFLDISLDEDKLSRSFFLGEHHEKAADSMVAGLPQLTDLYFSMRDSLE